MEGFIMLFIAGLACFIGLAVADFHDMRREYGWLAYAGAFYLAAGGLAGWLA